MCKIEAVTWLEAFNVYTNACSAVFCAADISWICNRASIELPQPLAICSRAADVYYLKVHNQIDAVGFVRPGNIAAPSVVFDVVKEHTNIIPYHPGSYGSLHTSLQLICCMTSLHSLSSAAVHCSKVLQCILKHLTYSYPFIFGK